MCVETVRLLLSDPCLKLFLADSRVDPTDRKNQALVSASLKGKVEIVEILLADSRVNPADQNNQAIKFANLWGHTKMIRMLSKNPRAETLLRSSGSV